LPGTSRNVRLNLRAVWDNFRGNCSGAEKQLSQCPPSPTAVFGNYPDTGLKAVRDKRDQARRLIAQGVDPSAARKAEKASRSEAVVNSFEAVAREWHATIHLGQVSVGHAARTLIRLEQDVFPWLGGLRVGEIKAPQLLQVMRRIEARGAIETAHRALQACGQVFRYSIATGRGRDRGSARARSERFARPRLQPDRVPRAAPQDAADVGRLPGQTVHRCRDHPDQAQSNPQRWPNAGERQDAMTGWRVVEPRLTLGAVLRESSCERHPRWSRHGWPASTLH
jgi:Arm DNA-binding domain